MGQRKAQIIWSSAVAVAVALLALYSTFKAKTDTHVFFKASPSPVTSLVKDGFVIR